MAGSAESVEQVWLLGRVVTVCWLGAALFVLAERGVPRMQTIRLPNIQSRAALSSRLWRTGCGDSHEQVALYPLNLR